MLEHLPTMLSATRLTLLVTGMTIVTALAVSIGLGTLLIARARVARVSARIIVEVVRGTSALIILFWIYFALPLVGITMTALSAAVIGLGMNAGAYGAEIVRSALQSVPKGQREAALALNFTPQRKFFVVILPQAVLQMMPQFGNLFIEILKLSSLVSLITITELTNRAYQLNSLTFETIEIFGLILIIYFLIAITMTMCMRRLEHALRRALT